MSDKTIYDLLDEYAKLNWVCGEMFADEKFFLQQLKKQNKVLRVRKKIDNWIEETIESVVEEKYK